MNKTLRVVLQIIHAAVGSYAMGLRACCVGVLENRVAQPAVSKALVSMAVAKTFRLLLVGRQDKHVVRGSAIAIDFFAMARRYANLVVVMRKPAAPRVLLAPMLRLIRIKFAKQIRILAAACVMHAVTTERWKVPTTPHQAGIVSIGPTLHVPTTQAKVVSKSIT